MYAEKVFPTGMNQTVTYLAASASAEFLADIALCPFESIKVRMQTTVPPFANTMREGLNKVIKNEGVAGYVPSSLQAPKPKANKVPNSLYKGLLPLWGRQIPYTMIKFATFEKTVEAIYAYVGKPKSEYNKLQQTGVSFLGGYIAGIGAAAVSHPADVMVSKLNSERKPGESPGKAMGRIYGKIGFKGLWNGLPVRIFVSLIYSLLVLVLLSG